MTFRARTAIPNAECGERRAAGTGGARMVAGMLVALHADDLGFSAAITEGICDTVRRGLLTGASVLANAPASGAALAAWRGLEDDRRAAALPSSPARGRLGDPRRPFDLGVHLNLSQGKPLTGAAFPAALLDPEGNFRGLTTFLRLMLPGAGRHAEAVRRELAAQIGFVCDHGMRPVRLDGHQYCELTPRVGRIVADLAPHFGVQAVRVAHEPAASGTLLRNRGLGGVAGIPAGLAKRALAASWRQRARRAGLRHADRFFGTVTAGRVGVRDLDRFLRLGLGRRASIVEIGLHPGWAAAAAGETCEVAAAWRDPLAAQRPAEHCWLVDEALPGRLLSRGVGLGRIG